MRWAASPVSCGHDEATAPLMDDWREDVSAKGQDPEAIEARFREIMGEAGALFQ